MLESLMPETELLDPSCRKTRLLSCACCRRIWPLLRDERSRAAIEVKERSVDGLASCAEVETARQGATAACFEAEAALRSGWNPFAWLRRYPAHLGRRSPQSASAHAAEAVWEGMMGIGCASAADAACCVAPDGVTAGLDRERAAQCDIVRDIFGNPFRPAPAVDPAWLAWHDGSVSRLAQAAYEERRLPEGTLDPARLGVLADALEDAGCADADLLGHLRVPGPHVRGCWAVDLLLDKR
jgi:hypothetical protein